LSGAGSGFTAAGGIFGDTNSADSAATLKLFGAGDALIDTRNVTVGDMGQGLPHTFFGWVIAGDEITRIEFDMVGTFEALDDFRFGQAVPEPSTMLLLLSGSAGFGFFGRRKIAA